MADHLILLVDTNNAFDSVSKMVMLLTVQHLWPRMSHSSWNYYRHQIRGWSGCTGGSTVFILIKEGVAQGDPFVIALYGIMLPPSSLTSIKCFLRCANPGLPRTAPWTGWASRWPPALWS